MTNHPLTDEICKTIYCTWPEEHQTSLVCDNMRAAADWQLEQVIDWGYKHLYPDQINDLVEAMRPTFTLENN